MEDHGSPALAQLLRDLPEAVHELQELVLWGQGEMHLRVAVQKLQRKFGVEVKTAPRRIAHLFAEVHTRLELIGRHVPSTLRTPFTQLDLADMCGVSAIHANRAVGKLRDLGIAEIRRGDLFCEDWDRLRRYARFDPDYLYGDGSLKLDKGWY